MAIKYFTEVWHLADPALNTTSKMVLLSMADQADILGQCWPSFDYIAERCLISRRQAIRVMNDLETLRYITKQLQFNKSNLYTVYPAGDAPPKAGGDNLTPPKAGGDTGDTRGVTPMTPGGDTHDTPRGDTHDTLTVNNPNITVSEPSVAPDALPIELLFMAFWSAYPNKTGRAKAFEAYAKAIKADAQQAAKEGRPPFTGQMINLAAVKFASWCVKAAQPVKYIKHPTTWLNQGCYADELPNPNTYRRTANDKPSKASTAQFEEAFGTSENS